MSPRTCERCMYAHMDAHVHVRMCGAYGEGNGCRE